MINQFKYHETKDRKSNKKIFSVKVQKLMDEYPDISYLRTDIKDYRDDFKEYGFKIRKWIRQDREMLRQYQDGDRWDIGIIATAKVGVKFFKNSNDYCCQELSSGGLWGISTTGEHDEYHDIVAREELDQLKDILFNLGFTEKAIDKAFENWEWEEE